MGSAHTRTTSPQRKIGESSRGGDKRVDSTGKQEVETFFGRDSSRWPIVEENREKMGSGVVNRSPKWTDEVVGWFIGPTIVRVLLECE